LTNGSAAGLSQRTIADLANDYTERAYANAQKSGGDTRTAELDADLRRRLAEMVLPEFVETEFGRVLTVVFRV
jgi:thymidylate synthase ThyX